MREIALPNQKTDVGIILSQSELERYHFLAQFMRNYNLKSEAFIDDEIKKYKSRFHDFYMYKISKNYKSEFINNLKNKNGEVLSHFNNVSNIENIRSIFGKVIPVSFLLSTISVLFYFYLYSTTLAGIFLFLYISVFLLMSILLGGLNVLFLNKSIYRRIFILLTEEESLRQIIKNQFNRDTILNKNDLGMLKKIITKKDFINTLRNKSININYSDVLSIIEKELMFLRKKVEDYDLNKIYDHL